MQLGNTRRNSEQKVFQSEIEPFFFTIGMNFFTIFCCSVLLAVEKEENIVFAHVKFVKSIFTFSKFCVQ